MLLHAACVRVLRTPFQMPILSCRQTVYCRSRCHYAYSVYIPTEVSLHGKSSPWLFVGLGNPGRKYDGTRHNVGFEMIDSIAQAEGISVSTMHCKALFGKGYIGNTPVLLAKPQTYMNLSGDSIYQLIKWHFIQPTDQLLHSKRWSWTEPLLIFFWKAGPLAAYYQIPLHHVVLIFDDMDLPCGVLRLQPKGGHGGHNGVKSVIHAFKGNRDFTRLRIGIGKPPGNMDPKAYVLQMFNLSAREEMNVALQQGVEAVRLLTSEGLLKSASQFNLKQKYKQHQV